MNRLNKWLLEVQEKQDEQKKEGGPAKEVVNPAQSPEYQATESHSSLLVQNYRKENFMDLKGIEEQLEEIFKDVGLEKHIEVALKKAIKILFDEFVSLESMKNKLQILFEYEEHYLKLIKEYKEEIKFCSTMQEDLRRERSQFFTQILKEVSDTLKKAEVESSVASQWVQDLVDSYTKSIDISSDLAKTHVVDVIGKIRNRAKKEIMPVKSDGNEGNGLKEGVAH